MIRYPLVSVIIPLYNAEEVIEETLESCLQQTYPNIEVIVVDDHSTDGSMRRVRFFQENYPGKIFTFINPGKGACASRNFAFEKASGKYIQYLDADDLLNPEKIKSQMNLLLNSPRGTIAHCQWGRFTSDLAETSWEEQKINKKYDKPVNWLVDSWKGRGMGQTSIWLTPRSLIKKAGDWNENLLINQDGEFFSRVILLAAAIEFSEDAKVYYRSGNPLSISQNNTGGSNKASSLLMSYELYHTNILQYEDSVEARWALGNNYLNYIYLFKNYFPDLAAKAEKKFHELELGKMWPVGGANFQRIAKVVGFNNALKLKRIYSIYVNKLH